MFIIKYAFLSIKMGFKISNHSKPQQLFAKVCKISLNGKVESFFVVNQR